MSNSMTDQTLDGIEQRIQSGVLFSEEEQAELQHLAETGNARAQYLYGMYAFSQKDDEDEAVRYWEDAASGGNPNARTNLGDYYFYHRSPNDWDSSYSYYTAEGTLPLTGPRRTAIKDILNHAKYNKRVLLMSIFFLAVSLAVLISIQVIAICPMSLLLGVLSLLAEVVVVGLCIRRHFVRSPYSYIYWMLPCLFGIWSVCMLIWLI